MKIWDCYSFSFFSSWFVLECPLSFCCLLCFVSVSVCVCVLWCSCLSESVSDPSSVCVCHLFYLIQQYESWFCITIGCSLNRVYWSFDYDVSINPSEWLVQCVCQSEQQLEAQKLLVFVWWNWLVVAMQSGLINCLLLDCLLQLTFSDNDTTHSLSHTYSRCLDAHQYICKFQTTRTIWFIICFREPSSISIIWFSSNGQRTKQQPTAIYATKMYSLSFVLPHIQHSRCTSCASTTCSSAHH